MLLENDGKYRPPELSISLCCSQLTTILAEMEFLSHQDFIDVCRWQEEHIDDVD